MLKIHDMTNLVNRLITIDSDMSVTKLAVILEVYNAGQTTPSKVADGLNLTLATASRHLSYWSAWNRQKRTGKGAIEYTEDLMDTFFWSSGPALWFLSRFNIHKFNPF